jgi:hypothetical protein
MPVKEIYKSELKAYLNSPFSYIILAIFLLFGGIVFVGFNLTFKFDSMHVFLSTFEIVY